MRIRVWGARGSVPTPARQVSLHGGNTSCVEVSGQEDDLLIFDAGSGLFPLGQDILRREFPPKRIHIVITHLHWDHIQGLPFFAPAFTCGYDVCVYSPKGEKTANSDLLKMQLRYSGLRESVVSSYRVRYEEINNRECICIGAWRLSSLLLNHPGLDFGYRVDGDGKVLCYCTDLEPRFSGLLRRDADIERLRDGAAELSGAVVCERDLELLSFISEADLCIQDCMYDDETYKAKCGWGHSPFSFAVKAAYTARVKRLLMFHLDPAKDDVSLQAAEMQAQALAGQFRKKLLVMNSREGLELDI